jgi:hypothetical protein
MMDIANANIALLEIHVIYDIGSQNPLIVEKISILPLNGGVKPVPKPKGKLIKFIFDSVLLEIFNLILSDTFSLTVNTDGAFSIEIRGKIQFKDLNKIQIDFSRVDRDVVIEFLLDEFNGHLTFLEENIDRKYNLIMIFNNENISERVR